MLFLLNFASPSHTENLPFQLLHQKNSATQEAFGYSVAGAGDVNGDGYADFLVRNYRASPNGLFEAGSAYVYSGQDGSMLYQVDGAFSGEWLGYSVAGAGNVDGDGRADFIIGAPNADSGGVNEAGKVAVYSGLDGGVLYEKFGAEATDHLGASVDGIGDLDGDGKSEFIVGSPRANPDGRFNAGSVYLYSGGTGQLFYRVDGIGRDDFLGVSVAGAGDVNADGRADFIVGAPYADPDTLNRSINSGATYVYSGLNGSLLFTVKGTSEDDYLGYSVAGAGDVNGDGKSDFIIGAPNSDAGGLSNAGWAGVYSGLNGSLLYPLYGDSACNFFGRSVAEAGDVNGDGKGDVIVGAIGTDQGSADCFDYAGSAYLFSGANGSVLFRMDGSGSLDEMGFSVSGAGDINADGRPDIIASAPLADSSRGRVFVYGLISTAVPKEDKNRPMQIVLSQNYPNPFNPVTAIRYYLPRSGKATLEIFNLLGERVKILTDEEQAAGAHILIWNGSDAKGKIQPSGIYFYRLKGKDFSETKKMVFLK